LAQYIKEFTGATACYIGQVNKPIKKNVTNDQNEEAHLLPGAK
jgi:hypothetical protein